MKREYFLRLFWRFISPLFVLLLLFGVPSVVFAWSYATRTVDKADSDILSLTKSNIELILNESTLLLHAMDENAHMRVALKEFFSAQSYDYENARTFRNLMTTINTPVNVRGYFHSIYVYLDNPYSKLIVSNKGTINMEDYPDQGWREGLTENRGRVVWAQRRQIIANSFAAPTDVVTIYRRFNYMPGLLVLNVSEDALVDIIGEMGVFKDQYLAILSDTGEYICGNHGDTLPIDISSLHPENMSAENVTIDGQKFILSSLYNQDYGWHYVSLVPERSAYAMPYTTLMLMFLFGTLAVAASVLVAFIQLRRDYAQLNTVVEMFSAAEKGDDIPSPASGAKGIYAFLSQNITRLFLLENNLKMQLIQHKLAEERAELQSLQLKLNPHFIFNTLESINQEILVSSPKSSPASDMVFDLSRIMRYSLNTAERTAPIYEEIENTRIYLGIMKYRYEGRIQVSWKYNADLLENLVLKFLLQPFVENAIMHGLKRPKTQIAIRITIRETDSGGLYVRVLDTGIGFDRQSLHMVRQDPESMERGGHIGIYNVLRRLALTYGDGFHFRIVSSYGRGTSVRIVMPPTKHSEDKNQSVGLTW